MSAWEESKHPRVDSGKMNGGQFTKAGISTAGTAARSASGIPNALNEELDWTDPDIVDWDNEWEFEAAEEQDPDGDEDNPAGTYYSSMYVGKNQLERIQAALRKAGIDMDEPEVMESDMSGDGDSVFMFNVYTDSEKAADRAAAIIRKLMK